MEAHSRSITPLLYRAKLCQVNPKRQYLPILQRLHSPLHLRTQHFLVPPRQRNLTRQRFLTRSETLHISIYRPLFQAREIASSMAYHTLSPVEASKRRAAYKAVEDHFHPSYRCIGIGSGSTVVYVVEAIAAKGPEITSKMLFIPTGDQSKDLILDAGLPLGSMDTLPRVPGEKRKRISLDVAFDGADEIDEDLNCIKGGGACLLREKLVATSAKIFICVADSRKLQRRLLSSWKTIPIEVLREAAPTVEDILVTLGSPDPKLRQGSPAKAGPVITDNGNLIIDAPFRTLLIPSDLKDGIKGDGENGVWEVHALGERLLRIVGVIEVGLFHGLNGIQASKTNAVGQGQKPVAAYFGMENGEVETRVAKEIEDIKLRS